MQSQLTAQSKQPTSAIMSAVRQAEDRHRAWLHDTVLQVLEYLATGGYGECTDPQRMMHVAARAADDLRIALDSETFDADATEFGTALHAVVDEARTLSDIELHLDLSELDDVVPPRMGHEVVAVVREALNNTRKHSGARSARVVGITHQHMLEVHVVDDGHGFDPRTVHEGRGIRCSMRERMAGCGGSVAIASAPGRGVMVRITGCLNDHDAKESVA